MPTTPPTPTFRPHFMPGPWPPGEGQDIQLWNWLIKLWYAMRERATLGNGNWPPPSFPFSGGKVNSVTPGEGVNLTIDVGKPDGEWFYAVNGLYGPRWVNYHPTQRTFTFPVNYDFVIEPDDPEKPWETVRGRITGQTPPNPDGTVDDSGDNYTVTIDGYNAGNGHSPAVLNAVTAKYLPSLDALTNRRWTIIKSGSYPVAERLPLLPNEHSLWVGDCIGGEDHYPPEPVDSDGDGQPDDPNAPPEGPLYLFLENTDTQTKWVVDRWVGQEVLVYAQLGKLHRATIIHNDTNRIYLTYDATWAPANSGTFVSPFNIVKPGARCLPGRPKWRPGQWYAGPRKDNYTHHPDDSIRTGGNVAARTVRISVPQGDTCVDFEDAGPSGTVLDDDYVINGPAESPAFDAICDTGRIGDFASPSIYTTFRMMQKVLLDICGGFVKTPPQGDQVALMYYAPELLLDLGSEGARTTIERGDGDSGQFETDINDPNAVVFYVVYNKDGSYKTSAGPIAVPTGGVVTVPGLNCPEDNGDDDAPAATDEGLRVTWALGFRRYYQRRVRYLYPRTCMVPDVIDADPLGLSRKVADPPIAHKNLTGDYPFQTWDGTYSPLGTGGWQRREASTAYAEFTEYGLIEDTGGPFNATDKVKLWGDNSNDPGIFPLIPVETKPDSDLYLLKEAYDRFFRGTYGPMLQEKALGQRSFTSTHGSTGRLTDLALHWYDDGVNSGKWHEHSAQVAKATETTFDWQIKLTDNTDERSVWLDSGRFDTAGVLVGFTWSVTRTLQVPAPTEDDPDATKPVDFTWKSPIRSFTDRGNDGVRFTFDAVQLGAGVGKDAGGAACQVPLKKDENATDVFQIEDGSGEDDDGNTIPAETVKIVEPRYTLNKWEGRKLMLTDPTGKKKYTAKVTHNDADTVWFDHIKMNDAVSPDSVIPFGPGWTVQIEYFDCGSVLQRNTAGEWELAQGNDVARLGVKTPHPFHANPKENLATYVKRYGLHRRHDRILHNEMLIDLYKGINLLDKTKTTVTWVSRADPDTPENNYAGYGTGSGWDVRGKASYPGGAPQEYVGTSFGEAKSLLGQEADDHPEIKNMSEQGGPPRAGSLFDIETQFVVGEGGSGGFKFGDLGTNAFAQYSYPRIHTTVGMAAYGATTTVYGYFVINGANVDEMDYAPQANDGGYGDGVNAFMRGTEIKFDPQGAGGSFREWSAVGNVEPGPENTDTIGGQVGSSDVQVYKDFDEPEQPPDYRYEVPEEGRATSELDGYSGYFISDVVGIITWPFKYRSGTW